MAEGDLLRSDSGESKIYPLIEGMNMGIWIGFKHVSYLVEHAISSLLRSRGVEIRSLYWGSGVSTHIRHSELRYEAALTHDEPVDVEIEPSVESDGSLAFEVRVVSERFGRRVRIAHGRYEAEFRSRDGQLLATPTRVRDAFAEASG